jgi:hypothetical protein
MGFWRKLIAVGSLIVLTISNTAPAFAQTPAGQGLEMSPPLIERSVNPGEMLTLQIKLRNITTSPLVTDGAVEDFVAEGEEGQPKLLVGKNAEPSPYTFKPWVQSITKLTLAPQEIKAATVTIAVPKDASPGGHYGVIRFTAAPPELNGTGVALSASLGSLVLLNVAGNVEKKASIAELYVEQNKQKKSLFEKGPVVLGLRLRNEGNVHIKPTGTLRVTNTFGKEVAVLSINGRGGNILPGSIRKFEEQLKNPGFIGRFKVEANVQYDNKNLSSSRTFWIIPYKQLAIGLGLLILLGFLLKTGIKKYNRYIIGKAHERRNRDR